MIRTFTTLIARALLVCATLIAANAYAAVDVNRASLAELESIKGIGPGLAGKIMAARQSGNFKDWNDLTERVKGVGPGNAARFSQAGLTVGGNAFENRAAGAQVNKAVPAKNADAAASKTRKATKADKTEAAPA